MQYLWQNDNRYYCKNKTFSHIFTMYFMTPHACIRKEWHIMNTCIIFSKWLLTPAYRWHQAPLNVYFH